MRCSSPGDGCGRPATRRSEARHPGRAPAGEALRCPVSTDRACRPAPAPGAAARAIRGRSSASAARFSSVSIRVASTCSITGVSLGRYLCGSERSSASSCRGSGRVSDWLVQKALELLGEAGDPGPAEQDEKLGRGQARPSGMTGLLGYRLEHCGRAEVELVKQERVRADGFEPQRAQGHGREVARVEGHDGLPGSPQRRHAGRRRPAA